MHVDPFEKGWIWLVGIITVIMLGVIFYTAFMWGVHPPSNAFARPETIDPNKLHLSGEFAEDNLGVTTNADGSVNVTMVAARYGFYPQEVEVPADTPVTIRITSRDVIHGFHVKDTNAASMVIPGYVSTVETQFAEPGEYGMLCNEYCGLGHHYMWSRFKVVEKTQGT